LHMCVAIILAAIVIIVIVVDFIRVYTSNCRYHSEQYRQHQRLMQENITLRREAMDAYRSMLREACREGGFWEQETEEENEED